MLTIDTHAHVIATDTNRYPNSPLGGHKSDWSEKRPVSVDQMIAAMDQSGISQAVLVQASTCYGHDNSYITDAVAARPDRFTGVFSVDVLAPDAPQKIRYWADRKLTGMRLFTAGSTMPNQADWVDDPRSFPAWDCAGELKLPVCMQMTVKAIPQLIRMLERFPNVAVLLDHLAKPVLSDGPPYSGAADVFHLAEYKNLYLKLTPRTVGEAQNGKATPATFFPLLVSKFGASRIAWGSNYPASEGTLPELVQMSQAGLSVLSADDREWIFAKTALSLYPRLPVLQNRTYMPETQAPLTLQTLLAMHSNTAALRNGTLRSPLVDFAFADVKPVNRAFKALVREQKFDLGEVAIATILQAKAYGKPYVLLPAVIVARGQHHTIFYNPDHGHLKPGDLNGRKVGVRAYTQTTGVWVRGFLEEDYGVDFRRVQWITFEDPHVAEFKDPHWVQRAPEGKQLLQMLLDGEIDAAIFGSENPEGTPLRPLIPNAGEAAARWAEKHGGVPINHMMVMKESLAESRPDIVREVYQLLKESAADSRSKDPGVLRFGVEAVRKPLETILAYAERQGLIPRHYSVDELFNSVTRALD